MDGVDGGVLVPAGVNISSPLNGLHDAMRLHQDRPLRALRPGQMQIADHLHERHKRMQQKDKTGLVDTSSRAAHDVGPCFLHTGYKGLGE